MVKIFFLSISALEFIYSVLNGEYGKSTYVSPRIAETCKDMKTHLLGVLKHFCIFKPEIIQITV